LSVRGFERSNNQTLKRSNDKNWVSLLAERSGPCFCMGNWGPGFLSENEALAKVGVTLKPLATGVETKVAGEGKVYTEVPEIWDAGVLPIG